MDPPSEPLELPIAETFYSLQGEGKSAGVPAVFLRVGGCNLLCGAPPDADAPQDELEPNADEGATWVCDTIETWRNPEPVTDRELLGEWTKNGSLAKLRTGTAHLVLTGGEPLLRQELLGEFLTYANIETVEVETNGTIVPDHTPFDDQIAQYNVSTKLSNSGMPEDRRLIPEAIRHFRDDPRATFKFVVSREDDLNEIRALQGNYGIPATQIMLMPAGATQAELAETAPRVADICKADGYRYSDRLHVRLWNIATGV